MILGAFGELNVTKTFSATGTSEQSNTIPIPGSKSCTVFGKLTSESSTKDITVKVKFGYGNGVYSSEITLGVVTATTSGADFSYKLERDFSGDWDENASDVVLLFTKTNTIAVTIIAGVSKQ